MPGEHEEGPADVGALTRDPGQLAVQLDAGSEAHAVITERSGKERRTIVDVAQVRIVEAHVNGRHNIYRVAIISCRSVMAGRELDVPRADLYARASRDEQAAIYRLVKFVWGGRYRGQQGYRGGRS